jgi:hypothetical protein
MVPQNPKMEKPNYHPMSEAEVLAFHIRQVEAEKGIQPADNALDTGEPEGSENSPSPISALASHWELNLESRLFPVSPANTPGNSLTILPLVSLPECLASASSLALKIWGASKLLAGKSAPKPSAAAPTQHSAGFLAEMLGPSNLLRPENLLQHSYSYISPVSDFSNDQMSAMRIATLEQRVEVLKARLNSTDCLLQEIVKRLKILSA